MVQRLTEIRVLLIEDDADDFLLTRDLLNEIGPHYSLEWARSYQDGLAQIKRGAHDLYIIDYLLGKSNGIQLLEQAIRTGFQIPVIVLTGQDDYEIDMAALQAGAADYLVKSQISASTLERSIRYALKRAQLLQSLGELAKRDELTGLYNRREMNRILEEEVVRFERYKSTISLILMDIDEFKNINDTYTHPVGDKLLQCLARLLSEGIRSADRAARYGGDEFAVIMPETTGDNALKAAERLRARIENLPCDVQLSNGEVCTMHITVSVGVAEIPADAVDVNTLIQAVDHALYQAKRSGRNRVFRYL